MKRYENKRLFIDVGEWGGRNRYITLQSDMLPAIWEKYDLSAMEERIFLYICMLYDNPSESGLEPIKLSYQDIADAVKCSKEGARQAIKNLVDFELIKRIGERKGKGKTKYMPNIDYIHGLLKEHLNLS